MLFVVVGEAAKLEEERRDRLGRGEVEPPLFRADRSDAVEERFCRFGVDLRLSSLKELELGMRRGVDCWWWCSLVAERGASEGESKDGEEDDMGGETGREVVEAELSD